MTVFLAAEWPWDPSKLTKWNVWEGLFCAAGELHPEFLLWIVERHTAPQSVFSLQENGAPPDNLGGGMGLEPSEFVQLTQINPCSHTAM